MNKKLSYCREKQLAVHFDVVQILPIAIMTKTYAHLNWQTYYTCSQ